MENYAPRLRQYARELRKNMTKEERKLWFGFLRTLPVTVKRQARIGCYIADFYIPSCRLAIELDGPRHYEEAGLEYDQRREKAFAEKGIAVVRYPNNAVAQNFSGVCEDILRRIPAAKKTETEN